MTPTDPKCQIQSKSEATPAFPFDLAKFGSDVLPVLAESCAKTAGCHANPVGQGNFTVWPTAKSGECDFAQSFNAVAAIVDLTTPDNSRLTAKVSGTQPGHFAFPAGSPELEKLRSYAKAAAALYAQQGGGTAPPPPGASPFDITVYKTKIAPMFERCATSGCHLAPTGQRGFNVIASATSDADINTNFATITGRTTLSQPNISQVYIQATVQHGSGTSKTIDATQAADLLAWITAAKAAGGTGTQTGCAPLDKFNLGTFTNEILPILTGRLNLNNNQQQLGGLCSASECHGRDRGPGTFVINVADPSATLKSFACFVDLTSPSASAVLACPTDQPTCPKRPHPGQDVFGGNNDLNYQRFLAFVFGAKADVSPFDFAFFVKNINPLFDDPASVQAGALGFGCSETTQCHGSPTGVSAPNGSNFPIIPNAGASSGDIERLSRNFVSASQFTTFLNPTESSLFLYPTDEIANTAAHKFATGFHHPGGLDFDANSDLAKLILQWSGGLRPDGAGFQRNWLVEGVYSVVNVTETPLNENRTPFPTPKLFDVSGGSFDFQTDGWDGLFSNNAVVDLSQEFNVGVAGTNALAYAASYVINTQPRDIQVQLDIASPNLIEIWIDGNVTSGNTANFVLKAAGTKTIPPRILVKVFQRANDAQFQFTAKFTDRITQQPLTDVTGELVFTLGPNGGI